MIKLLLDMGLPLRAAGDLRADGWDVRHVAELSMQTAPDAAILAWAAREGRAIVTLDSDFAALIAKGGLAQPSIIHLHMEGMTRVLTVQLLRTLIPQIEDDLQAGCIASVNKGHVRTRRLPVRTSQSRGE